MIRFLSSLAFVPAIAVTAGAFAQTTAPLQSATVNNVKVSGVAASTTGAPPSATPGGNSNLLKNFESGVPVMPVLTTPNATTSRDCGGLGCG